MRYELADICYPLVDSRARLEQKLLTSLTRVLEGASFRSAFSKSFECEPLDPPELQLCLELLLPAIVSSIASI